MRRLLQIARWYCITELFCNSDGILKSWQSGSKPALPRLDEVDIVEVDIIKNCKRLAE
jgi:hypothetical protein